VDEGISGEWGSGMLRVLGHMASSKIYHKVSSFGASKGGML
jgi:hypothetical protein